MNNNRNSNIVTWVLLTGFLTLVVAISCLLISLSTSEDRPILLFAVFGAILPAISLFYLWRPRGNIGSLLLRIPINSIILWSQIAMCIVFTLIDISLIIIIPLGNSSKPILNFSLILGNSLLILFGLSTLVRRIEIREKGINGPFSFTSWEDIASYRWHAQDRDILLVKVRGRKLINPKRFPIYNVDKVEVNQILQERVLARQEQPTKLER